MKKVLILFMALAFLISLVAAVGATWVDQETSKGNLVQAGSLDLKVAIGPMYLNGFEKVPGHPAKDDPLPIMFDFGKFGPLNPGDRGMTCPNVASNAGTCDGLFSMKMNLLQDDENVALDPEFGEPGFVESPDNPLDLFDGELGSMFLIELWADKDDNGSWETLVFDDFMCNVAGKEWSIGTLCAGKQIPVNIIWEMPKGCNQMMTDTLVFDVEFGLRQV